MVVVVIYVRSGCWCWWDFLVIIFCRLFSLLVFFICGCVVRICLNSVEFECGRLMMKIILCFSVVFSGVGSCLLVLIIWVMWLLKVGVCYGVSWCMCVLVVVSVVRVFL